MGDREIDTKLRTGIGLEYPYESNDSPSLFIHLSVGLETLTMAQTAIAGPIESLPASLRFEVPQGAWTIAEWSQLDDDGQQRIELVDGCLELPAIPSREHLRIQRRIRRLLEAILDRDAAGWLVETAPWKLRIGPRTGRVADVVVYREAAAIDPVDDSGGILTGDEILLVVEVVSPGRRQQDRDRLEKRADYAVAGIAEYWIVDPDAKSIQHLVLDKATYRDAGTYGMGDSVTSACLGEPVPVDRVFAEK